MKRQKEKLETMKREEAEEKERAKEAARERVLLDFEKGQLGLVASSTSVTTSATSDANSNECESFETMDLS